MKTAEKVIDAYTKLYGQTPDLIVRAPGRINIIGEHTDYNGGLVLPGAIDRYMYMACAPNGTLDINAYALDLKSSQKITLNKAGKTDNLWSDYLSGILQEFSQRGHQLSGFDCVFGSDLPIGAGMSSSSALECAFLTGIKELHNLTIDNWTLIDISKSSNHNFLGIKGGIMDQFASLFGKSEKLMLLNCNDFSFDYIDIPQNEYSWLLINSCVKHNHLISGYNDRVQECANALSDIKVSFPTIKNISAVRDIKMLDDVSFSSDTIEKRARYVVSENARVTSLKQELEKGNMIACGQLLLQSHLGLKNNYQVSCEELDFLVDSATELPGVLGARMMGGGFGGCTINLIHKEAIEEVSENVLTAYKNKTGIKAEVYQVNISDGAGRVK